MAWNFFCIYFRTSNKTLMPYQNMILKGILLNSSFTMLQMGSNRWPGISSFVVFTWYHKASEVCLCGLWCHKIPGKNYFFVSNCSSSVVLYITFTIATICWEPGHFPLSFFPSTHQISVRMISYTYGLNAANKAKMNSESHWRNLLVSSESLSRKFCLFVWFQFTNFLNSWMVIFRSYICKIEKK